MSPRPLVILGPRATDDSVRIWQAALEIGWRTQRLPSWRVPAPLIEADNEVMIYGEPLFAEAVADQLERVLLEPPPDWLVMLPAPYRKREVSLRTLDQARQIVPPIFVKPAEGKVFEPAVVTRGVGLPPVDQVDGALPVLCSDPLTFLLEVRCFINGRRIRAASPYWRNGALAQSPSGGWPFLHDEESNALAFVGTVLADDTVELPHAFVLDVGLTEERGWVVVEANPCWGAGLYGCDPVAALSAMRGALKPRNSMSSYDWKWTSPRIRSA